MFHNWADATVPLIGNAEPLYEDAAFNGIPTLVPIPVPPFIILVSQWYIANLFVGRYYVTNPVAAHDIWSDIDAATYAVNVITFYMGGAGTK